MRTGAKARSTKQKARENAFADLAAQQGTRQVEGDVEVNMGQQRLGKKVINIEHASLAFDGRVILDDFNELIQANQRIGITGPNGTGKSTLLNAIAGVQQLLPPQHVQPLTSHTSRSYQCIRTTYQMTFRKCGSSRYPRSNDRGKP